MAFRNRLLPQTIQSVAAAGVGASYSTLGTLTHPARIIKIINYGDQPVFISWDGTATNNNDFVAEKGFVLYDITANKVQDDGCFIAQNTVFSVKRAGTALTVGAVYLVAYYTLME